MRLQKRHYVPQVDRESAMFAHPVILQMGTSLFLRWLLYGESTQPGGGIIVLIHTTQPLNHAADIKHPPNSQNVRANDVIERRIVTVRRLIASSLSAVLSSLHICHRA